MVNPSFTKPFGTHTLYQGGGSAKHSLAISKTVAPINLKFCRILETPFNVLEMLKLFTWCLLGYHRDPQRRRVLSGKSLDFGRKYQYSNYYQIHNLKR